MCVFSLQRVANLKGNPSFLMSGITVSAPDKSTVVLSSQTPNPAVPFIVPNPALGILNAKAVQAAGGTDATDADKSDKAEAALNKASAGSGPYLLETFSSASSVVLKRNPKYWGDQAQVRIDRRAQRRGERAEAQRAQGSVADRARSLAGAGAGPQRRRHPTWRVAERLLRLHQRQSRGVEGDEQSRISRRPSATASTTRDCCELAGEGSLQAAGVVPSMFLGSLPQEQGVKRDVARAKAALAKSGLGKPTVSLSYPSDLQVNGLSFGDLAARVKQNLAEVGITVDLKPAPTQTALDTYRNGKDQMGLWYWGPDYPDPSDYLVFLPGATVGQRAKWAKGADPALEALGAQAQQTTDNGAREKLYRQIQERLNESSPFMPLIQPAQLLVSVKSVSNVHSNALWELDLGDVR